MNTSFKLLLLVAFAAFVTVNADVEGQTKCHVSCNCDLEDEGCAECNICTSCKSEGAAVIAGDFCQCQTPQWRLKDGSEYECVKYDLGVDVPECEWQLFNQIYNMVVLSNCYIEQDGEGSNFIVDEITYDWRRLDVDISEECKAQLTTTMLYSPSCGDNDSYIAFPLQYVINVSTDPSFTTIRIPLIDVFGLTTVQTLEDRHIYQNLCFGIELGHLRRVIRFHKFQMRVYTNRDQVEVFHLTVEKQITEGCDRGQSCIVVANLDTRGLVCQSSACDIMIADNGVYTVGDHAYYRIEFVDNTYLKFLHVVTVKFVDDAGIYNYVRNLQWWTVRQELGYVDIDVLLFQPHVNALIEVALKIALTRDDGSSRLRQLESTEGEVVKQNFNVSVKPAAAKNTTTETAVFAGKLFCGVAFAAIALLL